MEATAARLAAERYPGHRLRGGSLVALDQVAVHVFCDSDAGDDKTRRRAREVLTDTYQATRAMMAKLAEGDTAWISADRAAALAKASGDALAVAAAMYRWHTSS